MADTMLNSRILRFGTFELDLTAGELCKNGAKIRMQEQPSQFLAALVEKPGEVVTREELKDKLWPGDTYVDFDRSLNTAASKLREALGDSAASPRFVETLPRRGYRFLASVEPVGMLPGEGSATDLPVEGGSGTTRDTVAAHTSRAGWYVAGAVIATGLVAVAWFGLRGPATTAPRAPLTPVPLTSYQGVERHPTFSPDGNEVAFSWNGEDGSNSDIYRKLIGPGEPLQLTTDPADEYAPAWSPDGRYIAFLRDIGDRKAGIFFIPSLDGGQDRLLGEKKTHLSDLDSLAWSPDGKWLVVSDVFRDDHRHALFLVSLASGDKHQITFPPDSSREGDYSPSFSPDGRRLLFIRGFNGVVHSLALSEDYTPDGEPELLTSQQKLTQSAVWMPGGREIMFAARDGLWRMPASAPDELRPLASIGAGAKDLAVARNGGRLAFSQSTSTQDIWQIEVPGPDGRSASPQPFVSSTRRDYEPRWSPDGSRIAFTSWRTGHREIWICDPDGLNARKVTATGGRHVGWPNWSPDGKFLAYDGTNAGLRYIYVINADGGEPRRITNHPADDAVPSWSGDGKWIYFASQRTGASEVWKIAAGGGEAVPLTTTGGRWPYESPDRNHVYFAQDTGERALLRVPVDGGEVEHVLDKGGGGRFAVAKRGVYFIPQEENRRTINLLSFATGETEWVADIELPFRGLNVSPDGKRILLVLRENTGSDLMLVENFR